MGDFFERKKEKKAAGVKVPAFNDYDLSEDDTLIACGLSADTEEFTKRNKLFTQDMIFIASGRAEGNKTALTAKSIESHFSTREMAFLLSKFMIEDLIQIIEKNGK